MTDTGPQHPVHARHCSDRLTWIDEGLLINAFGASLKRRFGGRIQRVSLDAGFTCPNVDGAVTRGGCNFCDNRSFSPSRRVRLAMVQEQLISGITTVRHRYKKVAGFIAYFQPATNTYAAIDQLREVFEIAVSAHPEIVGLAIGTRPDCVPDAVLDMLQELAREHQVSIEYGMQSIHSTSLRWMNRAHNHDDMINAVDRTRGRGLEMSGHVILGVPGETHAMMMQTADAVNDLGLDSVKIHNLYAVTGTPLGDQVVRGEVQMMERDVYVETVVDFLQRLDPKVIVERISGDAPPDFLIAPKWCLEKSSLRIQLESEFRRRGTRQGTDFVAPSLEPRLRSVPSDQTPQAIRDKILGGCEQESEAEDPLKRGRLPVLKLQPKV